MLGVLFGSGALAIRIVPLRKRQSSRQVPRPLRRTPNASPSADASHSAGSTFGSGGDCQSACNDLPVSASSFWRRMTLVEEVVKVACSLGQVDLAPCCQNDAIDPNRLLNAKDGIRDLRALQRPHIWATAVLHLGPQSHDLLA